MINKSPKVYTSLADTFDVEDVVDKRSPESSDIVINVPTSSSLDADADAVRDTLYSLLKQGEEAFTDLKRIAVAEESPRSFEVLNNMLGQLSAIAINLMDVHEKRIKIKKASETSTTAINTGTVNNNTVFVGTTADLQDMIKGLTNNPNE